MNLMEFVYASNRAANTDELRELFIRFIGEFGIDNFVMADMSPESTSLREDNFSMVGNYPAEWLERYYANHFINADPVYQRGLLTKAPLSWDDVLRENLAPASRRVMDEAKEFGLRTGAGLSISRPDASLIGFGFASSDAGLKFSRDTLNILNTAAYQFHIVYADLLKSSSVPVPRTALSSREREVLLWIAHGKTKSDIAGILQVSESCVKRHCESIAKKLGTNTLAHSVAKAIRLRLIDP